MREDATPFFTEEEEKQIVFAIQKAEQATNGEIRVHVSLDPEDDSLQRTKEVFDELRMFNTQQRNAVLIHLSISSKKFAIYGDEGINQVVEGDFWECTRDVMQQHFTEGKMMEGVIAGIANIGDRLKSFFPHSNQNRNELNDEITYD